MDPRNGPAFDLPAPDAPARTYVVATTPRSGSTLLCRALWETGRVGAPKEYLNPTQLRDWRARFAPLPGRLAVAGLRGPLVALTPALGFDEAALRAHLDLVRARRTGPTGWFGLKVHHHHKLRWVGDRPLEALLGPVTWIRLRREDRLGQAISWVRARQTWRWTAERRPWAPARYDEAAITRALASLAAADAAWDADLAASSPLALTYEELVADLDGAVRRVLAFLGEAPPTTPVRPALARQADATTETWRARYLSRHGRGGSGTG